MTPDQPPKILIVDDDPFLLMVMEETCRSRFAVDCELCARAGLERLKNEGPYAVLISDRTMPGMDGLELLEHAQQFAPDTVRILITGDSDRQAAVDAINRGQVFYFLSKPCAPEQLLDIAQAAANRHQLITAQRRATDSQALPSVRLLLDVLGTVAPEALGRGQRLRHSMRAVAAHLQAPDAERWELAAALAPLGFAALPPSVMRRHFLGANLLPQEMAILRQVPRLGSDLLGSWPQMGDIARAVLYQAKNFDGTGFPSDRVAGRQIPAAARVLKILNDRSELESNGIAKRKAETAMRNRPGEYDPELLDAVFAALPDFLTQTVTKERPVLHCRVADLVPGQVLVSRVLTLKGARLLDAGVELTPAMIARLRQHAVLNEVSQPILVQDPEKSSAEPAIPAAAQPSD